jgi:hypothetical protein
VLSFVASRIVMQIERRLTPKYLLLEMRRGNGGMNAGGR